MPVLTPVTVTVVPDAASETELLAVLHVPPAVASLKIVVPLTLTQGLPVIADTDPPPETTETVVVM